MSDWFWNGFYATLGYMAAGGILTITVIVIGAVVYGIGYLVKRGKP